MQAGLHEQSHTIPVKIYKPDLTTLLNIMEPMFNKEFMVNLLKVDKL